MSEPEATAPEALEPEEQARADFYALLARLFSAPPDAALLHAIAGAPTLVLAASASGADEPAADMARAWDALRSASAATNAEAAREEYEALFVGVGRSEVSLYASHYLGRQSGRPLAEIRAALSELGLARRPTASEFEDHFALIFEVMRMLIAGDGERPPAHISEQRKFFDHYLMTWASKCCTAIEETSIANYYPRVAQFTRCFIEVEQAAFAIA